MKQIKAELKIISELLTSRDLRSKAQLPDVYENFTGEINYKGTKGKVKDAYFEIRNDGRIDWKNGIWLSGTWKDGRWRTGRWMKGIWKNGIWIDGIWENGTWHYGEWNDGIWKNGTFKGGNFEDGDWKGGKWDAYAHQWSGKGDWQDNRNPHPHDDK